MMTAVQITVLRDRLDAAARAWVSGKSGAWLIDSSLSVYPERIKIRIIYKRGGAAREVTLEVPASALARVPGTGTLVVRLTSVAFLQLLHGDVTDVPLALPVEKPLPKIKETPKPTGDVMFRKIRGPL